MLTQPMKVGGFVVRGIELCILTPETAELARENGETVYDTLPEAQNAVSAALRGVCDSLPTSVMYL